MGLNAGDIVQVLPPFDKQHPGEYLVIGFNEGGSPTLQADGYTFDSDVKFLKATGKTAIVPVVVEVDPVIAAITKSSIKEALFGGGDPVDNIAQLFGVKE